MVVNDVNINFCHQEQFKKGNVRNVGPFRSKTTRLTRGYRHWPEISTSTNTSTTSGQHSEDEQTFSSSFVSSSSWSSSSSSSSSSSCSYPSTPNCPISSIHTPSSLTFTFNAHERLSWSNHLAIEDDVDYDRLSRCHHPNMSDGNIPNESMDVIEQSNRKQTYPKCFPPFQNKKHSKKSTKSSKFMNEAICKKERIVKALEYEPRGSMIEPSFVIRFLCYFSYLVLILFAYGRMLLEWMNCGNYNKIKEIDRKNYQALYSSWQAFYTRYIYRRVADIFSMPITGNPGGQVTVLDRYSDDHNFTFRLTGHRFECINLASYDYLGFSQQSAHDPVIVQTIYKYGLAVNSIHELGMLDLHHQLEGLFAEFLGVESCIVFGMGFATNSTNIPSLADDRCLVLADERSHASAKSGIYLSKATFKYFKHNDCNDLEKKIRLAIWQGNPRQHGKPWSKIIIIVEGVYSMEGTIVDLPRLIDLKNKYKCYLYIDEAHSIGAVGPNGRGIVDYFQCDPSQVDLLMGTMTKSFAAAGGYIAGKKNLIDHIRRYSMSNYAGAISPPIIQQIINTVQILMNDNDNYHRHHYSEGERRIGRLLSNTHYMRDALKKLGFVVAGHYDSPVIPIMVYLPAKIGSIVRMAVRNGLALVCAGYPATSLTTNRIRLCMTAAHNKETLDKAIEVLNRIGDVHHIKYQRYGVL